MVRSERYHEYERYSSTRTRTVYTESRGDRYSRRRRSSYDYRDTDCGDSWTIQRDHRPCMPGVRIIDAPIQRSTCDCGCCARIVALRCHCSRCCAKEIPKCHCSCCVRREVIKCCCAGCPRRDDWKFTIPVVDARTGNTHSISISRSASANSVIDLLAPDRRRWKVMVHWRDGDTENLDDLVPMDEVRRKARHLVVKERRCVHWE